MDYCQNHLKILIGIKFNEKYDFWSYTKKDLNGENSTPLELKAKCGWHELFHVTHTLSDLKFSFYDVYHPVKPVVRLHILLI